MGKNKVVIFGLDGGTFDIILPMIERGELPVIASLMDKGAWGELQSTVPPDTAPAWVSMMTGVNPGKHGIFFFQDNLHNNYELTHTLKASDIKFPPLWSVLNQSGKRVLFVNVPFTYPPMEVNGIVISGMYIPSSAEILSYPESVYPEMAKRMNGYEIDDWSPNILGVSRSALKDHYDDVIKGISLVTEKRKRAVLNLLEENSWDFLMVVFTSIDRLQHLFWSALETNHDRNKKVTPYGQAIFDGYRQIDQAVGDILKKIGNDTTVVLASDHGFGPLKKHFYVNKWLEEIGLLKLKKGISRRKVVMEKRSLYHLFSRVLPFKEFPDWMKDIPFPIIKPKLREMDEFIDWSKTKAYGNQSGINLNLCGREPFGVVEKGSESEEILKYIEDKFYLIEDESKNKLGDWIKRKEDIFRGPYVEKAVDLYFSINNRSYLQNSGIGVEHIFGESQLGSGMHRFNGIFIVSGPFIRKGCSLKPNMVDIAPTVLYLMGLPVLEDMDGRVLEDAIETEFLRNNSVKHISFEKKDGKSEFFSEDDEDKIQASLKGLGYLS